MSDIFRKYIAGKAEISEDEFRQIIAVSKIRRLRRKQFLLQEGSVCRQQGFVLSGCLRTYSIGKDNVERIVGFHIENWWVGDRESLILGRPSIYNVDAIEDSEVLLFQYEDFMQLCRKIPAFHVMINAILERSFFAAKRRIHTAISYNAEQKYAAFLQQYPQFAGRIPLNMIASYLGICPETLSRIRRLLEIK